MDGKSGGAEALTTGIASTMLALEQVPAIISVRPGTGLQQRLYRLLLPVVRDRHPLRVLRARLEYWGNTGIDLELAVWLAELMLRQVVQLKLPATMIWSLLRLWCNALPTSRRFRNRVAIEPCPFGCGAAGGDDTRHFTVCPLLFVGVLPLVGEAQCWPCGSGISNLFLFAPMGNINIVILGAAFADALFHCFLQVRRARPRDLMVVGNVLTNGLPF
jgi:hypothetical protein